MGYEWQELVFNSGLMWLKAEGVILSVREIWFEDYRTGGRVLSSFSFSSSSSWSSATICHFLTSLAEASTLSQLARRLAHAEHLMLPAPS